MTSDEVRDLLDEFGTLVNDRKPFEAVWDEIDTNLLPNVSRLAENSSNMAERGQKRDEAILDGVPRSALTTFQSGFMGRIMSQTSDWIQVETPDEDMMDDRDTRMWLSRVNAIIAQLLNRSRFYPEIYSIIGLAGGLGTGTIYRYYDKILAREVFSARNTWEIYLADDACGENDTAFRRTILTPKQTVQEFGEENCDPDVVRMANSSSEKYGEVDVIHAVKPNPDWDPAKKDKKNKRFSSWYIDRDHMRLMRKGGYAVMPYSSWRVDKEPNESYGRGPGWRALADIKALYAIVKTDMTGGQMLVNPPVMAPEEKRGEIRWIPGGRMYYEDVNRRAFAAETRIDLKAGLERETDKRQIIERHFMVPFFMAMQQVMGMDRQRTAYEVRQIEQEAAILLGPYAMSFQNPFMDTLVEGLFSDAWENGLIPAPPPRLLKSLNGRRLEVAYNGPLAQAQRNFFNSQPYQRTLQDIQQILSVDPTGQRMPGQIMDLIDWDRTLKEMARANGLPEEAMLQDRTVKQLRDQRAKQIEKQQQLAALQAAGKAAPGLNQAPQPGSPAEAMNKQGQNAPAA